MEGLASLAFAVDCLEQREEKLRQEKEAATSNIQPPLPVAAPIPQGSSFAHAPRRVSSDSVCEEANAPAVPVTTAPIAPHPPTSTQEQASAKHVATVIASAAAARAVAAVVEPLKLVATDDMSPEMVTQMVENLADDGEFKGPPPAPPAPTDEITRVLDCDVLCGRGGETNHHSGNVKYRSLVKKYQPLYIMSKRRDKPQIASKIVRLVRHTGGRFLRKDKSNIWRDVGNTKAREKTSQALREGAPDLRGTPAKGAAVAAAAAPVVANNAEPAKATPALSHPVLPPQPQYSADYSAGIPPQYAAVPAGGRGFFLPPPPAKRMRFSGLPAQVSGGMPHLYNAAAAAAGGPQHAGAYSGMPGMGGPSAYAAVALSSPATPAATPVVAAATVPTPASVSPQSFTTAVSSADEDEASRNSGGETTGNNPVPRGCRLKLLKKRLQEQQTEN